MKRAEIEQLLPQIWQRTLAPGTPLMALLEVMEDLHAPAELALQDLDRFFNPYRAPDTVVPFLARWLDLERLFDQSAIASPGVLERPPLSTGMESLRHLVAIASELSRWRGTTKGLVLFLETAIGTRGFEVNEHVVNAQGTLRPFHLKVTAPAAAHPHQALIERIINFEKPAYVTYELEFVSPSGGP